MELPLDSTECRIIGVLIEKQLSTPEYYPLTLLALVSACNQKNNRRPVTHYQDFELEGALRSLYLKKWVTNTNAGGRAIKWLHRVDEFLGLDRPKKAVLAELLLRGPQQPGELRTNAARMAEAELATQDALHAVLAGLAAMAPPYAKEIGRRDHERANRWAHLLAKDDPATMMDAPAPAPAPAPATSPALEPRVAALEATIASLQTSLASIKKELGLPNS